MGLVGHAMNKHQDNILGIAAFATGIAVFAFLIHGCFYETKRSTVYYNEKEVCKQKCLPKPYDPKYIPDQCVCMEGEAK